MSKQINLVINSQGESERADCRAASADLFIDFFDEIRKLDRTVLAQILVHSPDWRSNSKQNLLRRARLTLAFRVHGNSLSLFIRSSGGCGWSATVSKDPPLQFSRDPEVQPRQ
jgi:hypothetical protein